ncbi:MAG: hypothetical protein ACREJ2_10380 [Planctomycetota bacterium]
MQRNMRARYERISQRERQAGGAVGAQGKLVQALGPAEPGGVPERIEAVEFDAAQDAEALGIKPAAAAEPLVGRRAKGGRKKSGAGAGLPAADESEAVGAADQESEAANADEVDLEGVDGDVGEDDFDDEWDEDEDEEDEDEGEDKE